VRVVLTCFSCFCGFQCEGEGQEAYCAKCGDKMRAWRTRKVKVITSALIAESADKRTENGGY